LDSESAILITAQNSLQILKLFSEETPELGVCEISHRAGFSKSIVSRMVSTFAEESILEKNSQTGKFRLNPVLFELGLIAETGGLEDEFFRA
jgi:DNA-binding IclR family transcriptional regulator